jgi:hypothetical protein
MVRPDGNNLKHYLGLILLCLVLYLPGLTTLPPVDRDTIRSGYASNAGEQGLRTDPISKQAS